jgi:ribosomal protein S14
MPKYIKLYLDNKQRRSYTEKKYRKDYLGFILGKKNVRPKKYSFNSYCFINKNPRSVYNEFALSRWMFKKYVSNGYISGIRKAGW